MKFPFSHAHKVCAEITQRRLAILNSICASYRAYFGKSSLYFEDPVKFSGVGEDVVSWTSKISNMVCWNKPQEAIGLFKAMLVNEQRPNFVTVLSVMRAVGVLELESLTGEIHGLVIKMGFESELSVVTALLGVYSVWDMEIVWKLFEDAPNKDLICWSAMVSACVNSGQYMEAFDLFRQMQIVGMRPNHVSILSILPACADVGALHFGKQIHGFSIKRMLYFHKHLQNALVDMYANCRTFDVSIQVFSRIPEKDLISWRSIIRGSVENECPEKALVLFLKMLSCCFKPDESIIQEVIGASLLTEDHSMGPVIHCYLLKSGFLAFVSVVTTLLQMYSKFGEVELARILFNELPEKDLIVWSAMISAYAQSMEPSNAFVTFKQMQSANEKPNEIVFVSLLQACSSMAAQEMAEIIHAHVIKAGYLFNAFLKSSLIDIYCKLGRIRQGKDLFDETPTKDLICWSSMVNGYGLNGFANEALQTFSNMLVSGIKPNDVIFLSILSACSHCGFDYEGWNLFYAMEEKYGIAPKLAHYACMVDLLSRQGNIEEAYEFVNKMPIVPDKRIWGALLAGCRKTHGSIEIAELVAKRLISLDPKNPSYYVILSNMLAEEGRWEDAERLRQLVDNTKEIGHSIIQAN